MTAPPFNDSYNYKIKLIIYSTRWYKFANCEDKKTPPPKGGKRRRHRKINHGRNLTIIRTRKVR
jgi:hypothetical protein